MARNIAVESIVARARRAARDLAAPLLQRLRAAAFWPDKRRASSPATSAARIAILVLGMHRSGTSVLTGCCGILGIELGNRLLGPREDNKKGLYEHGHMVGSNMRIVRQHFFDGYRCPVPKSQDWVERCLAEPEFDKIREIVAEFTDNRVFGLKDPRLCLTAPVWVSAIREARIEPRFIIAVRNPREVALSMGQRDAVHPDRAYVAWIWHYLHALDASAPYRRLYIDYDEIFAKQDRTLAKIVNFVARPDLVYIDVGRKQKIEAFVDSALRSHVSSRKKPATELESLCLSFYEVLKKGDDRKIYNFLRNPEIMILRTMASAQAGAWEEAHAKKLAELAPPPPLVEPQLRKRETAAPASWSVTCTIKAPRIYIQRFIDHYIQAGAQRVFLFFDDPDDSSYPQWFARNQVVGVVCDSAYWEATREFRAPNVEFRQQANLRAAISMNRAEWLLHVDGDELIYMERPIGEILADQPEDVFAVSAPALEAVYAADPTASDAFDTPWFKKGLQASDDQGIIADIYGDLAEFARGGLFGYRGVKSFFRSRYALRRYSVHAPVPIDGRLRTEILTTGLEVLHFQSLTFEDWRRKWQGLSAGGVIFTDMSDRRKHQLDLIRTTFEKGEEALLELYRRMNVLDPERLRRARAAGLVVERKLSCPPAAADRDRVAQS